MRVPSHHTLETIWGHEPLKRLVRSMLAEGRLPHAMLLHGPDAVGKRSLAFAIAKMILTSGLHVKPSRASAPSARFAWRVGQPHRSPDDDLFGGMDDLFGEAASEPEPEPAPTPKALEKLAEKMAPKAHEESPAPPAKKPKAERKKPAEKTAKEPAETAPEKPKRRRGVHAPEVPVDERIDRMVSKAYPIEWEDDLPVPAGHVDLNIIEAMPKAKSIKVDQVRMLQEAACIPPMEGRYRVILVLGADTITGSAANSLLKFLEEPPSYLVLILVTDHYHRILETIRSRCASLVCQPVDRELLVGRLVQDEKVDPDLARVASAFSEGRPGLALNVINGNFLAQRQEVFDARLAIDRLGHAALPMAVQRALAAGGGIGPAALLLLTLARDRMVRHLAPGADGLLVNQDLTALLDEVAADPAALYDEAERLVESLRMEDHPAVPAPQPALELALWPC